VSDTHLVRPGLYRFDFARHWLWVRLAEIAKIIGKTPQQTWEDYIGFEYPIQTPSGVQDTFPPAHYVPDARTSKKDPLHSFGGTPDFNQDVMVTAGYADAVIRAHRIGIDRVRAVRHAPRELTNTAELSAWNNCPERSLFSFPANSSGQTCCVIAYDAMGRRCHLESHKAWTRSWLKANPEDPESQREIPQLHVMPA
jgi:hypothetical protein